MWCLKSPIDGNKSVDEETFFIEAGKANDSHKAKIIYEKLSYIKQKDDALLLIADNLGLKFPNELFTFSKSDLDILEHNRMSDPVSNKEDFLQNIADKVEYINTYLSKDFIDFTPKPEPINFTHYEPKTSIKNFFTKNYVLLEFQIDEKKREKDYLKLVKKVYGEQRRIANQIFNTIDEEDKKGFFIVYKYFLSYFLHQQRDSFLLLKKDNIYLKVLSIYPLLKDDMEILLHGGDLNNNSPYITINPDMTCKWNYDIGAFADYFSFITEKVIGNEKIKNANWIILQKLFPQFKENNLRKETTGTNPDFIELMAKVPSFKIKYENKEYKEQFEDSIKNIISRHNIIKIKYPTLYTL
jgi:hypothetical protein